MSHTNGALAIEPSEKMLARLAAFEAEKVSSDVQCGYFGCDERQLEAMRSKVSR